MVPSADKRNTNSGPRTMRNVFFAALALLAGGCASSPPTQVSADTYDAAKTYTAGEAQEQAKRERMAKEGRRERKAAGRRIESNAADASALLGVPIDADVWRTLVNSNLYRAWPTYPVSHVGVTWKRRSASYNVPTPSESSYRLEVYARTDKCASVSFINSLGQPGRFAVCAGVVLGRPNAAIKNLRIEYSGGSLKRGSTWKFSAHETRRSESDLFSTTYESDSETRFDLIGDHPTNLIVKEVPEVYLRGARDVIETFSSSVTTTEVSHDKDIPALRPSTQRQSATLELIVLPELGLDSGLFTSVYMCVPGSDVDASSCKRFFPTNGLQLKVGGVQWFQQDFFDVKWVIDP